MISAMLVTWSPMRSICLAMNSRWVHGVMLRGILHHVGQKLAEQARIHVVDLAVGRPDRHRLVDISLDIGNQHLLDHLLDLTAHPGMACTGRTGATSESASERRAMLDA